MILITGYPYAQSTISLAGNAPLIKIPLRFSFGFVLSERSSLIIYWMRLGGAWGDLMAAWLNSKEGERKYNYIDFAW